MASNKDIPMVTSTPAKPGQGSETGKSSPPPKYEDVAADEDMFSGTKSRKNIAADFDSKEEIVLVIENESISCGVSDDDDTDSDRSSAIFISFLKVHSSVSKFYEQNKAKIFMFIYGALIAGYFSYFIAALTLCFKYGVRDPTPLIVITTVTIALVIIWYIKKTYGQHMYENCIKPPITTLKNTGNLVNIIYVLFILVLVCGIIVVIGFSVWDQPRNLISLAGITVFIIVLLVASKHPTKVNWRPVIGGFFLQFYFAVIILKWDAGKSMFEFIGSKINVFLSFTDNGTVFVFGDKYVDHLFAMKVLPVIVFFSCAISVLYYVGAMQAVISKIAWVMRVSLGTTAAESLCAAGNIFIGQTEAPILVGPFLELMTRSELHAVMTGGFATIAGGVLAAYVSFGVPAEHLLCASVMNAPCALAVSKLLYPETEESRLKNLSEIDITSRKERNILEAAAAGASSSIKLVANIAANLIAFLAMLAFVNAVFSWFGSFVGYPEFSFQLLCSYLLMPVAYLMGVEWKDAGIVGELIGIKTFLNEFIAYKELSTYITNKELCVGRMLSAKSEVIAIYALCGFANFSSIGIQLGGLGPLAPKRKGDLAQVVLRALLGGVMACLLTASIAGLLVADPNSASVCLTNGTALWNSTSVNSTLLSSITVSDTIPHILNTTASVL